jgi:hypothetical protein
MASGSWGNFVLDKGYKAGAALTKYRFVKLGAAFDIVIQTAASTDQSIGVAQVSVSATEQSRGSGKDVDVRMAGVSVVELSGTVAAGDEIMSHTDGTARVATSTNRVVGMALKGGTTGLRIPVLLNIPGPIKA